MERWMDAKTTYSDLPTECLLRVLNFLALPDIATLLRTSKLWNSIINTNEHMIYHRAAEELNTASTLLGSPLDALSGWLSQEASDVRSWKGYCRLYITTERRWNGKERPYSTHDVFQSAQQIRVGWIKIDTEKELLLMTGDEESDEDNCVVVPSFTRIEISGGFVIFGNVRAGSDSFEVWRWAEDQESVSQIVRQPTDEQSQKYERAMLSAGIRNSPCRGELLPMGVLQQPDELRAYRFVYPTLCVGNHAGDRLWLWDIRTRQLTQTIRIEPSPYEEFRMVYVDVNELHVFVATHTVSVYSRTTGECVFQLNEVELRRLAGYVTPPIPNYDSDNVFQEYVLPGYHDPRINVTPPYLMDIVVAVRASPEGDNCVAVTHWGYIILISGLKYEVHEPPDNHRPDRINLGVTPASGIESTSLVANIRISLIRAKGALQHLDYDGRRILVFGVRLAVENFVATIADGAYMRLELRSGAREP